MRSFETPGAVAQKFHRSLLAGAAVCCLLLAVGCEQRSGSETVGQKLDAAIDKTRDVASDVKVEAQVALKDAERRIDANAPRIEQGARNAGDTIKTTAEDVSITARISSALAQDSELSAIKIDVDTRSGSVVLSGPAPSESARNRASEIARGVPGVLSVDNKLVVRAG